MRFFLEFVSCCASPTWRAPEPSVPAEEDERWLVPASVVSAGSAPTRRCRKKQRRIGASDWRPSLGSISEDITAPPRKPLNGTGASAGRDVKKRTAAGGATKVYRRSYSDGYHGSSSMPMIMPAFSPTPFMF